MNRWEDRIYLFPDDQCATLDRLLCRLPEEHAVNMVPQIECLVLLGLSGSDELVLRLSVDGIAACEGGLSLVPFDKRCAVEEALPMLGQSTKDWLEVHRVSGEPDALLAFEMLWEQHVGPGLPAASAKPYSNAVGATPNPVTNASMTIAAQQLVAKALSIVNAATQWLLSLFR